MSPFVTVQRGQPGDYSLYAVLVHVGNTMQSGHYYCCVKVDGHWWKLNDAEVTCVEWEEVSQEQAYILFYKQVEKPSLSNAITEAESDDPSCLNSSSEEERLHSLNPNNDAIG